MGQFGIKPTEMIHDLLVLGFHALHNLQDDCILVIKVIHDIAGFFLALDVAVIIALGHQPVLGRLAVLRHHYHRRGICSLRGKKQVEQYQRIGIKWMCKQPDIANNPDNDDD